MNQPDCKRKGRSAPLHSQQRLQGHLLAVVECEGIDRLGFPERILVLEAGACLYPTHAFNICRFHNAAVAGHFACQTFWQNGDAGW